MVYRWRSVELSTIGVQVPEAGVRLSCWAYSPDY